MENLSKGELGKEKKIAGLRVRKLGKDESILHIIDQPTSSESAIARNSEIPETSMAAWEFLETYAQELFPEGVSKRLFGKWGKPQVAPILKKDGRNRVIYSRGRATAYGEMAGFDTDGLVELWDIADAVEPYYYRFKETLAARKKNRWIDSSFYHLASDVFRDLPELDPSREVQNLLDGYWEEFARLNRSEIDDKDLLDNKELQRKDMDRDFRYVASLRLVELGHAVSEKLIGIYCSIEKMPEPPQWKGKPIKNIVLFLLHFAQTSAQQMLMWWLGVAHQHLHPWNTVSRISKPDSAEAQISPLATYIIDFDAATVSADKLAKNDELYS